MRPILPMIATACLALTACGEGAGPSASAGLSNVTGLYEGGDADRRNQLCLIERDGARASFGLIVWGRGDANCSASGTMRRDGDQLRLLPDDEESCALDARIEGQRIALSGGVSQACARYYCGAGGTLDGTAFERRSEDAAAARDLAGEPLCPG